MLLKKFVRGVQVGEGAKWQEIFMMRMLYLKDSRKTARRGRVYVRFFPKKCRGQGKWKLFSFPICVTSKAFVSQSERKRKMRQHSHHNFKSSPFKKRSGLEKCFSRLDNDSDTEIKGKATLKHSAHTHTHISAERFTNIGKKYEIIKILDV